ncbi:MAG: hypothetical protein IJ852_05175 [Alphaproteobacteria bacterium]|nr:hypothetical protein [Alphaproteobacteria bacterium]
MSKMPALTSVKNPLIHLSVSTLLKQVNSYIVSNPLFVTCIFMTNMAFMLLYKSIPGGIVNPISIVWVVFYYIFWCAFYRYYYQLRPYIFSRAVLGSLSPSTKALFIMFLVMMTIIILPMLPLFLGYDDLYLDYYEQYVQIFEGMSATSETQLSFGNLVVGYAIMSLLAPFLICKPYMAWISSLRRRNASFAQAGEKMRGNYFQLVLISAMLLYPEALGTQIDHSLHLNDWLSYFMMSLVFVYTNIIFAKMYDHFYLKN